VKKPKQPIRSDSAPPFQKWAERDFLADTMMMHWQARMFYRTLLQAGFSTASTRPNLPANPDQLRRLLGGVPAEIWAEHEAEVLAMFTPSPDGLLLTHRRLLEDFGKLQDYRHAQAKTSSAYWEKTRAERLATSKTSERLATPKPLTNHSQEEVDVDFDLENETEGEKEISPPPSLTLERARELADYCVEVAKGKDTSVVFFPKSLLNIARVIQKLGATPEELTIVVREVVQPLSPKDAGFCGSIIEGVLAGSIAEYRKNNPQAMAAKMASSADAPDTWFPPKALTVLQNEADREAI
jgi:hypothetical protein